MTSGKVRKGTGESRGAAAKYGTLRSFFRGYLHQDYRVEHGSAEEAARAYRSAASETDLLAVGSEWAEFDAAAKQLRWRDVKLALARELGSSWQPASRRELERLGSVLTGKAP